MTTSIIYIHCESYDYDEKNKFCLIISSRSVNDPDYKEYRTVVRYFSTLTALSTKASSLRNILVDAGVIVKLEL